MSFRPYENLPVKRQIDFSETKKGINAHSLLSSVCAVEEGLTEQEALVDSKLTEIKEKVGGYLFYFVLAERHWQGD